MRLSPLKTMCALSLLAVAGCGGDKPASTGVTTDAAMTDDGGSSQGGSETGSPTTGGSAPASTGAADTSTGGTSNATELGGSTAMGTFIVEMDGGSGVKECDNWTQDCPEGQKCMPFADNGSNAWNATKCVDVPTDAGQAGDECNVEGNAVSGLDSCDKGVMCWDVDPDTQKGVCVALCTGSQDAPMCDADHTCFVSNDGVLNLCLLLCDPLAQDCTGDDLCIPNPQGQGEFTCVLDASGDEGQAFDPCEYINACDAGLFCANPANGMECDAQAIGCCLPFCDLTTPVMCPGVGQECTPWFEEGTAPPGYEGVGFCGIPM